MLIFLTAIVFKFFFFIYFSKINIHRDFFFTMECSEQILYLVA